MPVSTRREDEDESDGDVVPFQGLLRYERQVPVRQVSYYICGELKEPQYYTELFFTLRTASETDLIYLHLNSPGGDFNTGLQIINNIAASSARVVTILEARAYSMAALIFLSGDELFVHDNCQLMFHTYSGIFAGKGNEQQAEVDRILKGADYWIDSDDISRRLSRRPAAAKTRKPAAKKTKVTVSAKG